MAEVVVTTSAKGATGGLVRWLLKGMALIFLATITARAITFLSTIVLARLLAPSDFGIVNMGLIVFHIVTIFTDRGLPQALIQSRADFKRAANTAFILIPAAGIVICGAIMLAAPLLASVLSGRPEEQAQLAPVIALLAVGYVLHAIGRVPGAMIEKQLNYTKRALPEVLAPLTQAALSVALAAFSHGALGVWALAWGNVGYWVVWSATNWLLAGWRPSLEFDRKIAGEFLAFARDIVGVGALMLVVRNLDNAAVGKFLGAEQLGYYALAFRFSQLPVLILQTSINRVLFPAFARIQDDLAALRQVHHHAAKIIAVVSMPLTALIIVMAPDFVPAAYGRRWEPAIVPVQILALNGLVTALVMVNSILLSGTGRRKRSYPGAIAMVVLILLLLYPALQVGIVGVAALFTAAGAIGLLVSEQLAAQVLGNSLRRQVGPLVRPALAAGLSGAAAYWLFHALFAREGDHLHLGLIAAMAAVHGLLYVVILVAIDREVFRAVRQFRRLRRGADGARAPVAADDEPSTYEGF